jgi:hypothetical protein
VTVYHAYAGTYPNTERAEKVRRELADLGYSAELIDVGDEVHVRAARCGDYERALEFRQELQSAGYDRAFVTRVRSEPASADDSASGGAALPADSTPAAVEGHLDTSQEAKTPEEPPASEPADQEPRWWESLGNDPGCVLMTKEESQALLAANRDKRDKLQRELGELNADIARRKLTVYVGSYRDREQAELAAARAARHGISLEVQPDDVGGWLAAAECDGEVGVARLHWQLDDAGLTNNARGQASAAQQRRIRELDAARRELDEQDTIARECIAQYRY